MRCRVFVDDCACLLENGKSSFKSMREKVPLKKGDKVARSPGRGLIQNFADGKNISGGRSGTDSRPCLI